MENQFCTTYVYFIFVILYIYYSFSDFNFNSFFFVLTFYFWMILCSKLSSWKSFCSCKNVFVQFWPVHAQVRNPWKNDPPCKNVTRAKITLCAKMMSVQSWLHAKVTLGAILYASAIWQIPASSTHKTMNLK